jgi:hypothetical protein
LVGKIRARQNSLKHGLFSREFPEERRAYRASMMQMRRMGRVGK